MLSLSRLIIALACFLGCTAGFVVGYVTEQAERYAYIAQQSDAYEDWHYLGDLSNQLQAAIAVIFGVVMAAFTYMLYRVAASQEALLKGANTNAIKALDKADEANNAAKDNAAAFIASQRGILAPFAAPMIQKGAVQYGFENIGGFPIVITGLYRGHGWCDSMDQVPVPPMGKPDYSYSPIKVGSRIGTAETDLNALSIKPFDIPADEVERFATHYFVLVDSLTTRPLLVSPDATVGRSSIRLSAEPG